MNNINSCSIEYNKTENTKINKFLSLIYKDLQKSYKYVNNITISQYTEKSSYNKIINNKYFPDKIQKYIIDNSEINNIFTAKINNKNVTLNFFNCNISEYTPDVLLECSDIVFILINLLSLHTSNSCSKKLNITIYLTPFKKLFPTQKSHIIGVDHVNSGFSNIGCLDESNITIYREEEWIKVLIHELFHNLNLDFSSMNIDKWSHILKNKFDINSDFAIYETYCETWARILNVAIKSYSLTKKDFIENFKNLIYEERIFSLSQANKILNRFDHSNDYRENSNVFCYYILTASLINNYLDFFLWCDKNNTSLFKFKNTEKSLNSFVELILTQANSKNFKNSLNCSSKYYKYNNTSLRMTIV